MKSILITGASSGIGKECTKLFAKNEWHVLAAVRDMEKGKELEKEEGYITAIPLDITSAEQIEETSKLVLEKGGVDVLFNNAGYGMKGALEDIPEESIRKLLETNLIGPMKFIQKFIPFFKEKKNGMILTTTSLAGCISFPLDSVYNSAKRGMEGLCEALYYELKPYHVKVKTIVPGAIKTGFHMETFENSFYDKANQKLAKILIPDFDHFVDGAYAAQLIWEAVNDESDQFHYLIGEPAVKLYREREELGLEKFKEKFYSELFE